MRTFKFGGVHPQENKISEYSAIETLSVPKTVTIPVTQSLGTPSITVVEKGDKLKVGQLIAKGEAFISSNVHSSVSGTVSKIDDVVDVSGYRRKAVFIDVDGDEWLETIDCSKDINKDFNLSSEEIISKVHEGGIVGLGGATFPSHIKLKVPQGKKVEVLIINGVECEPYLTSDHRLMLEKGEEIMVGVRLLMTALNVNRAIIGIENNKLDAIQSLTKIASQYNGIEVVVLKVKYPQGGEKQLVKAAINREVPSGKLPIEVGVVVHNVGTAFAVYEVVQKNKPLIERVVTLTGKSINKPSNFLVRFGTPLMNLIEAAGGLPKDTGKVISGGPMMGKALNSLDVPIVKGMTGIVILPENESRRLKVLACIRCGKCVTVCPMGVAPYIAAMAVENEEYEIAEEQKIMDCMECGSCQFTCPSARPLLDYLRVGKSKVGVIVRNRANK